MKAFLTPYIYITIFSCCFSGVNAQNLILKITSKDPSNYTLLENLKFKEKHSREESLNQEIDSLSLLFEKLGYLNNRVDTIIKRDSIYTAYFKLGLSIKKIKIFYDKNQIEKVLLADISKNINENYFEVPIDLVENSLQKITMKLEEQGNSFSTIQLSDITIKEHYITAVLNVITSQTRTIDKVIIKGIDNFPKAFIKNYFNINQNTLFSKQNITKISSQLKALPFVTELKAPEVLFTNDSTYVYLYVKEKKSNKFDGLIGFFSNEESNRLQFNGYLDLTLNNIFNSGESIQLNWSNNGNERQLFNFSVETPYLFNSSLTPKIALNIYRQDSTFINTTANIALKYALNYRNKIGLSYVNETSTDLLDNSINNINSYATNLYGVTYQNVAYNNSLLFPLKFNTVINIFTGNRETTSIRTKQTKLSLEASYLWNLNAKNNIYVRSSNAILLSDNYLTNELYRIGGVNSIRGFNEESILSTSHTIFNIEYRFTTTNTSYVYSITDFAYVANNLEGLDQKIYSLGLGYAFNTDFGLLNLSYALGKLDEVPFNLDNSRVHLKIISFF